MPRFIALLLLTSTACAADDEAARQAGRFFESTIRPLLASRCFECHGEKKQKGGLRLDHAGYLKTGGDSGPPILPGNPDKSALIDAVRYHNKDLQMPPKEKLPDQEIAALEQWVKMGAPWPESGDKVIVTAGGFTEEQRKYWFFQPLAKVTSPQVATPWVRNEIDRFVAQKLAEMKLDPAPEADRRELARRIYFDLLGLPPTPAQMEDFVNDPDPHAYDKLVDQLLASPHYGERWAQHWLDLVRYAESDGYNADAYRPSVWPYRDYVIQSLNDDKPYDQFVREQLAGDEFAPHDPKVLIATSYLRNPVYEWNQRDVRGQWDIILTDITDTTGELFMGLSMGCARCHNHKFDPILQKDYYRLKAFFAPVQWRDDLKLATKEEEESFAEKQAAWEKATTGVRAKLSALIDPVLEPKVERALVRFTDDLQSMVRKPEGERSALEKQLAGFCERQMQHERDTFDPMKSLKSAEAKAAYHALDAELKKFDSLKPKPLLDAFVATDAGQQAPPITLPKTRRPGQGIAPGFLTLLEPQPPDIKPSGNSSGRRTVLANWLTRPDNPLTTRVIVNRIWQYHFGRGIVATSSDFGKLGESPSHPELLDWLAKQFVDNGWSFKKLHREILLSATYRQTARRAPSPVTLQVDPANKYLWRFHPQRLDAEEIRDAMLAASGELDLKAGGPAEDGNSNRRSIYTMKKRNNPTELLRALDAPAGFASTAERQSTTTPTQALLLVNGEWPLERARKLAARVKKLDDIWIYTLGRPPTDRERATAETFLKKRGAEILPQSAGGELAEAGGDFKENTPHERLLAQTTEKEGDEFTVEGIFSLNSIDPNASVRTLASRWTGGKDSMEAFGWSLGVTGVKSRFKPRNLIVQLVGEDENANIGYEVVASNLRVELGRRYHVVARVSCVDHNVSFRLEDLSEPGAMPQTAVVSHAIRSKLGAGAASLVIGGLHKRAATHQWDGRIEALRISSGRLEDEALSANPDSWKDGLVRWKAAEGTGHEFAWSGAGREAVDAGDAYHQALDDLCQAVLNTNEFFYLH